MITKKMIKDNGPLISAFITVLISHIVINYSYTEIKSIKLTQGFFVLLLQYMVYGAFLGCVLYTSWYAIQQKYQKQYLMWYYCIIAIFYVVINAVLSGLLSFIIEMDLSFYYYNIALTLFYMIMPVLLIWQYLLLKKLTKSTGQLLSLVVLTILTILVHFSDLFFKEIDFLTAPFSLGFLTGFVGFLLLIAVLNALNKRIQGIKASSIMVLWNIRLAFILGFLGADYYCLLFYWQSDTHYIGSYRVMVMIALKLVIIWFYTKRFILPVQPLYILWSVVITLVFSSVIVNSLFYFIYFILYLFSNGSPNIEVSMMERFSFSWLYLQPIFLMAMNILVMVFSFKLFFPRINN